MPSVLDISYAMLFAVGVTGFATVYFDRQLRSQLAAGAHNARLRGYRRAFILQVALAAGALILWKRAARPWRLLGLVPPTDWRLWVGIAVMVVFAALVVRQNLRLPHFSARRIEGLRRQTANVSIIMPHSDRECRWFILLSCAAGCCEELLYRGYLTWLIAAYVGVPGAIVLASLAFGLAHAYQGARGVLRTGLVALVMAVLVLVSGWLVPAMVIHALGDVASGVLGYYLVRHEAVRGQTQDRPGLANTIAR